MTFTLDNQTLLYIVIALLIVNFLIMRYYLLSLVEDQQNKNNKRIIKKVSMQLSSTLDQYLGNTTNHQMRHIDNMRCANGQCRVVRRPTLVPQESDSVDDPAENGDENNDTQPENDNE